MNRVLNRISLVITLVFFQIGSNAQEIPPRFSNISVEDGLSQSSVFAITQDSYGFMWFGTRTGGLNRFDGRSFKIYKNDPEDPYSISGNEILRIFEDSKGRIWVGTRDFGINRFDYEKERFYNYLNLETPKNIRDYKTVTSIEEDKKGRIWIGTLGGLCLYDAKTDSFTPIINTKTNDTYSGISSLCLIQDSILCTGTKEGVLLVNVNSKKLIKEYTHQKNNPNSITSNNINFLSSDSKNRLWIGTRRNGLNLVNDISNNKVIRFENTKNNSSSISSDVIRVIAEDQHGTIWICTPNGLNELSQEEQTKTTPIFKHHKNNSSNKNSLVQNTIFSFYEDKKGNLWMGTWDHGVAYLNTESKKFEHIRYSNDKTIGLYSNAVNCFTESDRGIWIGTDHGGLSLLDRKQNIFVDHLSSDTHPNLLKSDRIRALYWDEKQSLWIGTFNGLTRYDPKSQKGEYFLEGRLINAISLGENNDLWLGTNRGLIRFDRKTHQYKTYIHNSDDTSSLAHNIVNFVHTDPNHNLWIGTKRGLHLYNHENDSFTRFGHSAGNHNSLSNGNVVTMANDENGALWVGTYNGLNMFNPNDSTFQRFFESNGLPDNVINGIVPSDNGHLWISTSKGLVELYFNSTSVEKLSRVRHFTKEDGLQGNEFIRHAQFKDSNGDILFGGVQGFNIFNPDEIKTNQVPPAVFLSDLKLFNKSVEVGDESGLLHKHISLTKEITLKPSQSVVTFQFAALSYTSSKKNKFAFMLEGFDEAWNFVETKNEATYTSLPPGTYTLRVKASNNDGIWNEEGIFVKVEVLAAWTETTWFRVMVVATILLIGLGIYLLRIHQYKIQKTELKKMVSERTAELEIAYTNVKTLSKIGEEIIVSLSVEKIIDITYQQIHPMIDAPYFSIGLYDKSSRLLVFKGVKSKGEIIPDFDYSLDDSTRLSVWCFNKQQPILIKDLRTEYQEFIETIGIHKVEGEDPLSLICIPLNVKEEKIGIISIQSPRKNAYTKYHQDILQNIAIYTAIALDNADAYSRIETQTRELIDINIELKHKQNQIQNQIKALSLSEVEHARLNKELKTINKELVDQQQELEDAIEQLKEAQSQALHAEKMASIGVLTAGVAHEINNPLNFIKGGELAIEDYIHLNLSDHVSKLSPLLDIIKNGISRASSIVNSLNRFNRNTDEITEKCDINLILDNCLNILASSLKHRIQVTCHYTRESFILRGNEGELHQLFLNILTNAEQSISKKGAIQVKTQLENNFLSVTIKDSGYGISPENVSRVTEPFFTTKDPGQGTGLGMSIVYSIVASHQGNIEIDSEIDSGTLVTVNLPVTRH